MNGPHAAIRDVAGNDHGVATYLFGNSQCFGESLTQKSANDLGILYQFL